MSEWAQAIIEKTLEEEEKKEKKIRNYLDDVEVKYMEDGTVLVIAQVESKSRPGLKHKTVIATQDDSILMKACDCEGFKYHKKCWHLAYLTDWLKKHNLW